jgi:predicted transcriptional regulator
MRTMAIRVDDEVHATFVILSQVDGISLSDELKLALDNHVARRKDEPGFAEKAQAVLEEIDKEAAARRTAIQSLFTDTGTTEPEEEATPPSSGSRGRKQQ